MHAGHRGYVRPWLPLTYAELVAQRPAGVEIDVHFAESLVETVLDEYTVAGDVVLDPFAGFGTTLVVAERMGRTAIGVELLPERVEAIRRRGVTGVVTGDARHLAALVPGPVDVCLTSPPYMTAAGHPENPLTAYRTSDGDYGRYLGELGEVFRQVAGLLCPGGYAVVNVANTRSAAGITPLAWDFVRAVSPHLVLRHETFLCWDRQPPGISGDYCLVFSPPGVPAP